MTIFQKVTLQSLRRNRMRTLVTIIGIVLSTALICAVTTSVASAQRFLLHETIYNCGSWQGSVLHMGRADYEKFTEDPEIEQAVGAQLLGYAEVSSRNEYKPYLCLYGMAEDGTKLLPIHLTAGEYPDAPGELLIPEHLAENGGVSYQLGDMVTLNVGERWDTSTDAHLYQSNSCYHVDWETGEDVMNEEEIRVRETVTYTVVGVYERPYTEPLTAPGYSCLTVPEEGDFEYDVYFTMKHPSQVYSLPNAETNDDVLMALGHSDHGTFYQVLYQLAAIIIILILFGSVSLIYNAFSISVSERTKQFGLLSSIGATKKQLRRMVRFEAIAVSAIGIPIGIVVGIVGIGITLYAIGEKFAKMGDFHEPLRMYVSVPSVAAACLVALLTVLISAWIPSRRATKVTAVEAIRQTADIRIKGKKLRTPKWIYRVFGLPGMLAHKQFRRSRRRYRATIVSLFMSVVLFISASAFTDYLSNSVTGAMGGSHYDLRAHTSYTNAAPIDPEDVLQLMSADEHCDDAAFVNMNDYNIKNAAEDLFITTDNVTNVNEACVCFISDAQYRDYLRKNGISEAAYTDPAHPLALAVDRFLQYNETADRFETVNILSDRAKDGFSLTLDAWKALEGCSWDGADYDSETDEIRYRYTRNDTGEKVYLTPEECATTFDVEVGAVCYDTDAFFFDDGTGSLNCLVLLYPYSLRDTVLAGTADLEYYQFFLLSEEHAACKTSLDKTLAEAGYTQLNLLDVAQEEENARNLIMIIQVFSYGFIILISLIAIANVFNTISTNIALRRREFAMLRSVGMTQKDLYRVMSFECVLYGARALLFGLPVSCGVTVLIWSAVNDGISTSFFLPWGAIATAVCSVFVVVFATMLYAMRKIRKDNPIDALKNENL